MSDNVDIARLQRIVLLARDMCRQATDLLDAITTEHSEDYQQQLRYLPSHFLSPDQYLYSGERWMVAWELCISLSKST